MLEGKIMEIKTFYFNPLRECCYVAWDESGECVIIDPGCYGERELQRIKNFVEDKQLRPVKILLTHGHFDHILGLNGVAKAWNIDVYVDPSEKVQMLRSVEWCENLGLEFEAYEGEIKPIADGDVIRFGNTELKVISTPGHTEADVCFYNEKDGVLFSGDTLFAGSIGRTDHPGGDYDRIIESIHDKLMCLDGDVTVLPGHGPATSIGYERSTNPFIHP